MNGIEERIPDGALFVEDPTNIQTLIECASTEQKSQRDTAAVSQPYEMKDTEVPLLDNKNNQFLQFNKLPDISNLAANPIQVHPLAPHLLRKTSHEVGPLNDLSRKNSNISIVDVSRQAFQWPQP